MLGVANVRLALLYSTILFLSREGFRRACLNKGPGTSWTQVVNLVWCVIPVTFVWSVLFAFVWLYLLDQPDHEAFPQYTTTVICLCVIIIIELSTEPLVVISQSFLFVRLKVILDGLYNLVRCVCIICMVLVFPDHGLHIFACAQITCVVVYVVAFYGYFYHYLKYANKKTSAFPFASFRSLFPQLKEGQPVFDSSLVKLVWSFSKQSFLKQILTEGERYVMTVFDILSFADQGVYDVVNNLGSITARFLFLPIEDSGYLFFSKALQRSQTALQQKKESLELASRMLAFLLRMTLLIGITVLVFGYSYSYLALDIYGGNMLSSGQGPTLLRWHAMYVAIIAINGVTECFVFAVMSKQEVDRYNSKMVVFSALFLITSWYFTKIFGAVGFTLANSLNMAARIIHSIYFINNYYKGTSFRPLQSLVPSVGITAVLLLSLVMTSVSEVMFCCDKGFSGKLFHIGVGGMCLLAELAVIYFTENEMIGFIREQFTQKHAVTKKKD
ncbi:protein RFT1 homolog isoform X2 [Liolophura sinensis]